MKQLFKRNASNSYTFLLDNIKIAHASFHQVSARLKKKRFLKSGSKEYLNIKLELYKNIEFPNLLVVVVTSL